MLWKLLVPTLLLVIAFLCAFTPVYVTVWVGIIPISVTVSSDSGSLRAVSCQAFGHRHEADFAVGHFLPMESDHWSTHIEPFTGEQLTVSVPTSGRDSLCGREISRMQFRHLAVIGQLPDGRRVGKVVEIPDCRVSKTVHVTLP